MMTRRQALRIATFTTAACAVTFQGRLAMGQASAPAPTGPFKLPPLPYSFDALEPHIDAKTMEIHHDKHHAAYIEKLNAALKGHDDLLKMDIVDLITNLDKVPEDIRTAVRNNGGGHANHSFFWTIMSSDGGGEPKGKLAEEIKKGFGSFEDFKDKFKEAALNRFGSGWVWT